MMRVRHRPPRLLPCDICGLCGPWPLVSDGPDNQNLSPVDPWSMIHVGTGALAMGVGMPLDTYTWLAVCYEFLEQFIERKPGNFFNATRPESYDNAVADVVFGLAGYLGAKAFV